MEFDPILMARLAIATAVIAVTVSNARIFEWLRKRVRHGSQWLGYLVGCFFCLSFYVAVALHAVYQFGPAGSLLLLVADFIVNTLVIIGVTTAAGKVLLVCITKKGANHVEKEMD